MTDVMTGREAARPQGDRQVVTVHLGGEIYGIDIASIHTVITPQPITTVPKAPFAVKGVLNLRGRVVPVIDLRVRFGLSPPAADEAVRSRIVIVDAGGRTAGLIVDAVSEVVRLPLSAIDSPSALVVGPETECITGIGRIPAGRRQGELYEKDGVGQERLIILLDIGRILLSSEAAALTALAQAA